MAKTDKMIEVQKQESAKKVAFAKQIVDMMIENGEAVTPYTVHKKSNLSKAFIYTNEEIQSYIAEHRSEKKYNYRKYTPEDVKQERIQELEKEVEMLRKALSYYKQETMESLINQNQILKYQLEKYEKLVEDGIIVIPEEVLCIEKTNIL